VVHANLLAAAAAAERVSGSVLNVATGTRISLNETVEVLKSVTGFSGAVNYAAERGGDVKHSLADIRRAKEALGYEPIVSFREGLARTVAWYRSLAGQADVQSEGK
jgi:UDP-glucose 4-epimerase